MACVKSTAEGDLVVELFNGRCLTASELCELDVNWRFFNQFVRIIKNILAELPKTPGWGKIQENLPQTAKGGACHWQDIVIILLIAPFLTQNNIAALCRKLEGSPALCTVLGMVNVPSQARISVYKNHLLGKGCFVRIRLKLVGRLKRQGHLELRKLIIDGAPLFGRLAPCDHALRKQIPIGLIRLTFEHLNLSWADMYYPKRTGRQIPTSTVLKIYLLMYWLGMRSLGSIYGWLTKHPEVLPSAGLADLSFRVKTLRGFRRRFKRFVQKTYGANAPFQTLEDLIEQACGDLRRLYPLAEIVQLDSLKSNSWFFNLFRYRHQVSDPDAMTGYCRVRQKLFFGYRLILIVEASTKLPLWGCVFPGNREDGSVAPSVLNQLSRAFSLLTDLSLSRQGILFADLAYEEASILAWTHEHGFRLVITSRNQPPSPGVRWAKRHRIRVEQALSDLVEFFSLSQLRTITLPFVQTFVEVILTARVAQALTAVEAGHTEAITAPSYPAFGK